MLDSVNQPRRQPRTLAPGISPQALSDFGLARRPADRVAVVARHSAAAFHRHAARRTRRDPEDAVQEAVLCTCQAVTRPESSIYGAPSYQAVHDYIWRAIGSKVVDAARRQAGSRDASRGPREVAGGLGSADSVFAAIPAREQDTADFDTLADIDDGVCDLDAMGLEARELLAGARRAIEKLSPEEREILRLDQRGMSQVEIAEALGMPRSTVQKRLREVAEAIKRHQKTHGCSLNDPHIAAFVARTLAPEKDVALRLHIYGEQGTPGCFRCAAAVRNVRWASIRVIVPPPLLAPVAGGLVAAWHAVKDALARLLPGGGGPPLEPTAVAAGAGGVAGGSVLAGSGGLKVAAIVASAPLAIGGGGIVVEKVIPKPVPAKERRVVAAAPSPPAPLLTADPSQVKDKTVTATTDPAASKASAAARKAARDLAKARAEFEPGPATAEAVPPAPPPPPPHPASAEFEPEPGSASGTGAGGSSSGGSGGGAAAEFGP